MWRSSNTNLLRIISQFSHDEFTKFSGHQCFVTFVTLQQIEFFEKKFWINKYILNKEYWKEKKLKVAVNYWKDICCTSCEVCDLEDWNWNFLVVEDICGNSGKSPWIGKSPLDSKMGWNISVPWFRAIFRRQGAIWKLKKSWFFLFQTKSQH